MSNTYVIQWKSKVNGRAGRGTKQFSREQAEQLVQELNQEYPQILHEVVPWRPSPVPEEQEQEQPTAEETNSDGRSSSHHQSPTSKTHQTEASSDATTREFAIS